MPMLDLVSILIGALCIASTFALVAVCARI
jgi:hypothetical protein